MTRAVFDWVESPGTTLDSTARLNESKFGDGYAQRSPDGLNPLDDTWSLRFRDVDDVEATAMITFFKTNIGLVFDWMPLWSTTNIGVICKTWSRSQGERWGASDISATFERVYEP